ncbi:MAG: bifunctional phosphopantothenoylcysteine decarboxylase/phosphopantothenate--cysteine ligase CoaBC, partial [Gammaproteobacteria bacterium]|nr:bifunctional phosphopantothenoylcysteine decarboxylase/phosphopantothenate--cysteine ligase CoaBC [Gammaproteobacteria bacterium]
MGHIELARWADAILIAPASANFIAKLAQGRADDLLSTICLASKALLAFAPAMNQAMWHNTATQTNCKTLRQRGLLQFGPASGEQACGDVGEGRLLEVPELIDQLANCFEHGELQGVNVMITAGPTYEPIDPVRFIGNRSSGRMGYALAEAAREAGATVTLISGPCQLSTPDKVKRIDVETAKQMHKAVFDHLPQCDIFIAAAAVADYRPVDSYDQKLKKNQGSLTLTLTRNPDILSDVAHAASRPFVVGFAAETENLEQNARDKLTRKNLDMIAANLVGQAKTDKQDIGFNSEYNALQIFWAAGGTSLELTRKSVLARQLIQLIINHYKIHKKDEKNTA